MAKKVAAVAETDSADGDVGISWLPAEKDYVLAL